MKIRPHSVYEFYLFIALALLELLMSFSFLGYFHIAAISITIAYVPILISAICLDIPKTVVIGALFGMTSAYKASVYCALPADMIFSPFRSGEALNSLILSVGARVSFALIIALLYRFALKRRHCYLLIALVGLIAPSIHASLVFYTMGTLFPQIGFSLSNLSFKLKDILIALFCSGGSVLCLFVHKTRFMHEFRSGVNNYQSKRSLRILLLSFITFVIVIMTCVGFYFSQRMAIMLERYNVFISAHLNHDLLQQQLQFAVAALSLSLLLVLAILAGYRYMAYHGYLGELDALTNVLGRRIFFENCLNYKHKYGDISGKIWFLILDVDYFKQINDAYGHLTGDNVLRHIASLLNDVFGSQAMIGRIGGDEFAILIKDPMSAGSMQGLLNEYFSRLHSMNMPGDLKAKVSCSIGACLFEKWLTPNEMMSKTDKLLYKAKHKGRTGYVLDSEKGLMLTVRTKIFDTPLGQKSLDKND